MAIKTNTPIVLRYNLKWSDGSTVDLRKQTGLRFVLTLPDDTTVPITELGYDKLMNQVWVRIADTHTAMEGTYKGNLSVMTKDLQMVTTGNAEICEFAADGETHYRALLLAITANAIETPVNMGQGYSPKIVDGVWFVFDDSLQSYVSTGQSVTAENQFQQLAEEFEEQFNINEAARDAKVDETISDFSDIIAAVPAIEKEIGEKNIVKVDLTASVTGKYVGAKGVVSNLGSAIIYSDINLSKGDTITFYARVSNSISAISVKNGSSYSPKVIGSDIENYKSYSYKAEYDCIVALSSAYEHTNDKAEKGSTINERLDYLESKEISFDDLGFGVDKKDFTHDDTMYIRANGTIKTGTTVGFISSGISVNKGDFIKIYLDSDTNFGAVCEKIGNDLYQVIKVGVEPIHTLSWYSFTADRDMEIVVSGYRSGVDNTLIYVYSPSSDISNYIAKIGEKDIDSFGLERLTSNPIEVVKEGGFASLIRSWAFIGDSMSSGEIYGYEKGSQTTSANDDYWISWGQFMCRMFGSEGYNYSKGGESAKSWCVSEDNGRRWDKLKTQIHEAYIIALGQNDHYWVSATDDDTSIRNYPCITKYTNRQDFLDGTITISENDVRLDIDLTDYNNNANSYVGYYAGIIQRIKSVNELGFIFLMTNPQASAPNQDLGYKYYNDCIRHIYNIFKSIYPDTIWLLEMDKYSRYKDIKTSIALNGLHFGSFGYKWSAMEISTYIDWIIRNNMAAFQSISLVIDGKKATKW